MIFSDENRSAISKPPIKAATPPATTQVYHLVFANGSFEPVDLSFSAGAGAVAVQEEMGGPGVSVADHLVEGRPAVEGVGAVG